jgi:ankyrin repeat protein
MKIQNTIYWALFNMSFAVLYCFYYVIPLTVLTISIIALSSITLAFIEYKLHLYYIDKIGHLQNAEIKPLEGIRYGDNVNFDLITDKINGYTLMNSLVNGYTPLHLAAGGGHTEDVIALAKNGADINNTDNFGLTPMHWAARGGYTETVMALIKHGANVNSTDKDDQTLLHFAARNDYKEIVIALAQHGADVHATDNNGKTPLHYLAAQNRQIDTVTTIIDKFGADVHATDNNGRTPLHLAAQYSSTETVIALIERGANIDATDEFGQTPLQCAASKLAARYSRAEAFMNAHTDVNATAENGRTLLYWDEIYGHTPLALIEHGANLPDVKSNIITTMQRLDWWTDLHTAVIYNNLNEIRTLEYTPSETSPLDIAIMIGNIDAVRALIDRGIEYDENKCLRTAIYSNRHELAQLFLEKGANPLSTNKIGQNAFHFAAARGNASIMKIFVDNIRKKDNAAISIQRGYRSGLFKKNKANSTQEPTPPPSLGSPAP